MSWIDFLLPLVAVLASLPPVTLALFLWRKTADGTFRLFFYGLGFMALIVFLDALAYFLPAFGLSNLPAAEFLLWNILFGVTYASLVILRRFTARLITPGRSPGLKRLTGAVAVLYLALVAVQFHVGGLDLGLAFPLLATGLAYIAALVRPALHLWLHLRELPSWLSRMLRSFFLVLLPASVAIVAFEVLRLAGVLSPRWISLLPLFFAFFFSLIAAVLFRTLLETLVRAPDEDLEHRRELAKKISAGVLGEKITNRELEILAELLGGKKNRQIAEHFSLSESTVKNHIYNLFQKIGVDSRSNLRELADHLKTEK